MRCIDLKEDRKGVPCVTEINIGRFFMITPLFDSVGRHDMGELHVRLAFGELPKIAPQERFGDIGSEETHLVREVDNEPEVLTAEEIGSRYEDHSGHPIHAIALVPALRCSPKALGKGEA